jgi:hypothetical protein
MLQRQVGKKSIIIASICAIIGVTVVVFAISHMPSGTDALQHEDNTVQHTHTYSGTDVKAIKGLRTRDNTGCVNPPHGPMIC